MKNLRRDPKNILTREEAQELLSPFFADCFIPAIQAGLNKFAGLTADQRTDMTARTKASILNDYVAADLEHRIREEELDIQVNEDCGFKLFVFGERAALRIKKVDRQSNSKNIQTEQQRRMELQLELPGVIKATYVTLGYHLDVLWDKVLWVKIICRCNGRQRWILPVSVDPLQAMLFKEGPASRANERKARVRVRRHKAEGA